jgi:hypothetical protein
MLNIMNYDGHSSYCGCHKTIMWANQQDGKWRKLGQLDCNLSLWLESDHLRHPWKKQSTWQEVWTVQNHSTMLNGQIMKSFFKIQGHGGSGFYSSFFALSLLQSLFFRIFQRLFAQYMICLDFWLVGVNM